MTNQETNSMSPLPSTPPASVLEDGTVVRPELEALYKDGYPKLVRHLRYRGVRRDVAECLAQEAFVKAIERLDTLREPDKALAWLRRVAENLFYDRYRKEGPDRLLEPDPEEAGAAHLSRSRRRGRIGAYVDAGRRAFRQAGPSRRRASGVPARLEALSTVWRRP